LVDDAPMFLRGEQLRQTVDAFATALATNPTAAWRLRFEVILAISAVARPASRARGQRTQTHLL
jgi:hypothetical protein